MDKVQAWIGFIERSLDDASHVKLALGILASFFAALYGASRLASHFSDRKWKRRARKIKAQLLISNKTSHFTEEEIQSSILRYVVPDCTRDDPANSDDLTFVAEVRESVFTTVDRFFSEHSDKRHLLILADSGMGKTTFCLNYYNRIANSGKGKDCALISLSREDALINIRGVINKRNCILILDALDEDQAAQKDAGTRLAILLRECSDFSAVIVTCRSQFFPKDEDIPFDTGIPKIIPRRGGESPTYKIHRLYLMPFNESQIEEYLAKNFPRWKMSSGRSRREAQEYIRRVPELAVRPMLLELLPNLVRDKKTIQELYDLYDYMVDSWLKTENWIEPIRLNVISQALAVSIYMAMRAGGADRVPSQQLREAVGGLWRPTDRWELLGARSLLNRDSEGNFKFAHRSILEFLFVKSAVGGIDECFAVRWTDFMRQLFVSWGYSRQGRGEIARAHSILRMNLDASHLIPLSEPPEQPGSIKVSDFPKLAARQSAKGRKRSVPRAWKSGALTYVESGGEISLHDLEYDLAWLLPSGDAAVEFGGVDFFRCRLTDLATRYGDHSGYRLPSYEEFVSLIECESALNVLSLFREKEFYWIADQLGPRQHLVVNVSESDVFREKMFRVDGPRPISWTTRKLSVFEISIYNNPSQLNNFKAVPLALRDTRRHL